MYICIEGPDGVGKSTLANLLSEYFLREGKSVFLTKEPGTIYDPINIKIRQLLLDPDNKINSKAALLLFLADRAQHMDLIQDRLSKGYIVISDRSSLSTFVYHAASVDTPYQEVAKEIAPLLDFAQQIQPDVALVCTADFDWSVEQLKSRAKLDRIEQFKGEFHRKTHTLFSDAVIKEIAQVIKLVPKRVIFIPPSSDNPPEALLDYAVARLKLISDK